VHAITPSAKSSDRESKTWRTPHTARCARFSSLPAVASTSVLRDLDRSEPDTAGRRVHERVVGREEGDRDGRGESGERRRRDGDYLVTRVETLDLAPDRDRAARALRSERDGRPGREPHRAHHVAETDTSRAHCDPDPARGKRCAAPRHEAHAVKATAVARDQRDVRRVGTGERNRRPGGGHRGDRPCEPVSSPERDLLLGRVAHHFAGGAIRVDLEALAPV
jgi:hypothetical protein